MKFYTNILLLSFLTFTGCSVSKPSINYNIETTFVQKDSLLDSIIKDYLSNNLLLLQQQELINQSFFNKEISKISLFPSIDSSYNFSKSKNISTGLSEQSINSLSLNSSLELDIWHSLRNTIDSNFILEKIAIENYKSLQLDHIYNIYNIYNNIIFINKKLIYLDEKINIYNKRLIILKNRYKLDSVDLTDISTIESSIDSLYIEKNTLLKNKMSYLNELKNYTHKDYSINELNYFSIKSDDNILKIIQRPDLKASLLSIENNGLLLENTIKDKYPKFTLSTSLSSDNQLSLNNLLLNLVGNIAFPIIDYNKKELLRLIQESKLNYAKYNFSYLLLTTSNELDLNNKNLLIEENSLSYLNKQFYNYSNELTLLNLKSKYSFVDVLDFNSKELNIINIKNNLLEVEFNINKFNLNKAYISNNLINFKF